MVEGHEGESNWIDEVGAKGFTSSEEVVVLLPLNVGVLRIVMGGNRAQTAKSAVDAPILPRGLSFASEQGRFDQMLNHTE